MKIKNKIIIWVSFFVIITIISGNIFFYYQIKKILYNSSESILTLKANIIAKDLFDNYDENYDENDDEHSPPLNEENELNFENGDDLIFQTSKKNIFPKDFFILIFDKNSEIIDCSDNLNEKDFKLQNIHSKNIFYNYVFDKKPELFFIVKTINYKKQTYYLFVGQNISYINNILKKIYLIQLIVIPFIFIFIISGIVFIIKKGFNPLTSVIKNINSFEISELSYRIPIIITKDEVEELASAFNKMLERIEVNVKKIQQFTSDASHEIRTPLSVIKTNCQIALKKSRSSEEYIEFITDIKSETIRLEKLINELLLLTRLDNWKIEEQKQKINIKQLLLEIIEKYKDKLSINIICEENLQLSVFLSLFVRIFENLLDNTVKFAGQNTNVEINVNKTIDFIKITYKDNGKLLDESISKFLDRFYQSDDSRTGQNNGYGLGLSIVKSIIKLHNGNITISKNIPKGINFDLLFPLK